MQKKIKEVLYKRPTQATAEYFTGKTVMVNAQPVAISQDPARDIYRYLLKNDYVDRKDHISEWNRTHLAENKLAPLPEALDDFAGCCVEVRERLAKFHACTLNPMWQFPSDGDVKEGNCHRR